MKSIIIQNINELEQASIEFLKYFDQAKTLAFYGSMGAGKTTFIKEVCKQLQVKDVVNSPTFAIVNEYSTKTNQIIYHFDLYRLEKIEELLDIGFEDYLHQGNWVFIEWPEIAEPLLPEDCISVKIEEQENGSRKIYF